MIQKPEELASGYLLLREAGSNIIMMSGNTLDQMPFGWDRTYDIIAPATLQLGEAIKKEILSPKEAEDMYKRIRGFSRKTDIENFTK